MSYKYRYAPSQLVTGTFQGCDLGEQYYRKNNVEKLNHLLCKAYQCKQGAYLFEILDEVDGNQLDKELRNLRTFDTGYAKLITEDRILILFFTTKGEDFALGIIDSISSDYTRLLGVDDISNCELESICFEVYQLGIHTLTKTSRHGKEMTASDFDTTFEGQKLELIKTAKITTQN